MALKLEQSLKLSQQLVMTPQLQMAIKLLQMTRLELTEAVQQEMLENPTLEEVSLEELTAAQQKEQLKLDDPGVNMDERAETPINDVDRQIESDFVNEIREIGDTQDTQIDWQSYFENYMDGPSDFGQAINTDDDKPGFEKFLSEEQSLFDNLMWQVRFSKIDPELLPVAEEIVGNIDDDGYLKDITLEEIAALHEVPLAAVEKVHKAIMQMDPPGVGARNLQECLLAQALFLPPSESLVATIIRDHWDMVEKRLPAKIARKLGVSQEEVLRAIHIITGLNPRPGALISETEAEYIVPDVYVHKIGDDYHIVLNEDGLPRLRISQHYQRTLADKNAPAETREYIKGKLRSASWLIRSIQQRQRTIYKVAESIVRQQRDFLDHGVAHMKPMVLSDIAQDIEMHECTVSRVTSNKYIHTPQGIFELKYFFNSGIRSSAGVDVSSESIKDRIRSLIEKENPEKPLSDQKLVQLLKQEGMDVARRTVAKYREAIGILPSSGRRKTF